MSFSRFSPAQLTTCRLDNRLYCILSTVHYLLYTIYCTLSTVHYLLYCAHVAISVSSSREEGGYLSDILVLIDRLIEFSHNSRLMSNIQPVVTR